MTNVIAFPLVPRERPEAAERRRHDYAVGTSLARHCERVLRGEDVRRVFRRPLPRLTDYELRLLSSLDGGEHPEVRPGTEFNQAFDALRARGFIDDRGRLNAYGRASVHFARARWALRGERA